MGLFTSINIASTGLAAERLKSDVISDNIANASTTRTQDGGPYKRSRVIFKPAADENPTWRTPYLPSNLDNGVGKGVNVQEIVKDTSRGTLIEYPNVNIVNEMVDLIASSRAYEANTTVIEGAKSMFSAALEIGR